MFRWVIIAMTFFVIGGCSSDHILTAEDGRWSLASPRPLYLRNIPDGDDSYSSGFRAGCNDSMGISGYGAMQLYEWKLGSSLLSPVEYTQQYNANRALEDSQYSLGFGHGFSYCGVAANAVIGF
jgi:hypothetical protein